MLQKFPISQELVCSLFINEMLPHADTCTLISGGSVLRGCVPRADCDSPHMLPILEHSSPLLPQPLPPTTDTLKSPLASLSTHPPVLTPLPHSFLPQGPSGVPGVSLLHPAPPHTHDVRAPPCPLRAPPSPARSLPRGPVRASRVLPGSSPRRARVPGALVLSGRVGPGTPPR